MTYPASPSRDPHQSAPHRHSLHLLRAASVAGRAWGCRREQYVALLFWDLTAWLGGLQPTEVTVIATQMVTKQNPY